MAAKPVDSETGLLSDLAAHAHKLVTEFISPSADQRTRAADLIYELEQVVAEFRRLRPPPALNKSTRLRLIPPPRCPLCDRPTNCAYEDCVDIAGMTYHRRCYNPA